MSETKNNSRPTTTRYDSIWVKAALVLCLLLVAWTTFERASKDRLTVNQKNDGSNGTMHLSGSDMEVTPKESASTQAEKGESQSQGEKAEENDWSQPKELADDTLPPLDSLLGNPENIQRMLYYTVVGFPKCGTTNIKKWMVENDELCSPPEEFDVHIDSMTIEEAANNTMKMLYELCPEQNTFGKRGFKYPDQLYSENHRKLLRDFFPTTKLIVGVRHPVIWFQSYYNFRIRLGFGLPPPLEFLNNTKKCYLGVCLDRANMHTFLSYLGKTVEEDGVIGSEQEALLNISDTWSLELISNPPLPQKIFLYDVSQLDSSKRRHVADSFWKDLSQFLELNTLETNGKKVPENHDREPDKIDICDPSYLELRKKLVNIGKASSQWILNHFIPHPDVTISSPKYLALALRKWGMDPCK